MPNAQTFRWCHLAVCLATLLTTRGAEAQAADPKREVMTTIQQLFDGMRAGDSAALRRVLHPSVRMLTSSMGPDGKPRLTIESSADGWVKAVGTPRPQPLDERIWNEKVEIDGALASVWVDYALYIGPTFLHCGVDHFLLVRNDAGAWKIVEVADTRHTERCEGRK